MIEIRHNEPHDTQLNDPNCQTHNRYGHPIDTVAEQDARRNQSLNINGDSGIGDNPNRYKQHGFFFNADNCIACHACETACSEKNNVAAHQSFRSVGFVEGGTYPTYQRINLSMACNHCDDPVCLKGCPTRAYTKFAEYGAVLQDPDICFGCGYCTWVCPYNAPQLDPVEGTVSKCNMCVDRLEVGLKPACVSACLGKALDFGVIENIPEGQQQAKTRIPGLPRTDITHPNIRFQQIKATQREMTRSDAMPIKYHRDETGEFTSQLDAKHGHQREWNWSELLFSHESSHSVFTLSTQAVIGAFIMLNLGQWLDFNAINNLHSIGFLFPILAIMVLVIAIGLFKLNMHLGKPHRFYRGFNNLRHSPVSREIAGISGFFTGIMMVTGLALLNLIWPEQLWPQTLSKGISVLTILSGVLGLFYMVRLYLILARPYWNHWQTTSAFIGTTLSLGALLLALLVLPFIGLSPTLYSPLAGLMALGLSIEAVGLLAHASYLAKSNNEGAASAYLQATRFGYPWLIRNILLILNIGLAIILCLAPLNSTAISILGGILLLSMLVSALIGRGLFYAVVIPTTMPGGFFWKNSGFVEHARQTGLAKMPQLGVAYERHHAFKWEELLTTVRDTLTNNAKS